MRALLPVVYRLVTRLSVLGGRYLRRRAQAMHSLVRPAALASAAVPTLACSDGAHVTDPVRSDAPAFAIADGTRGFRQRFTATVADLLGGSLAVPVVWTSEDESVASVDAGGLATGVGPGSTTITATVGHLSASAALTVEPAGGPWARISAGRGAFSAHTCSVSTAGRAFCWGAGSSGELGEGRTVNRSAPVRASDPF